MMTLLITVVAAVVCTIIWYRHAPFDGMKISTLCFMYWGASLMWFVDAIAEYIEFGSDFFQSESDKMLNDAFLGVSEVAFGMIIWIIILLVKDPRKVFHKM